MTTYACPLETPLGPAIAGVKNDALTGLWFMGQKYFPQQAAHWAKKPGHPTFAALRDWLDAYFAGKQPEITFPLAPGGTPFQAAVWAILLAIPYGKTTTYGDIAKQLAGSLGRASMSAQAVGGAVGRNPISVIIPCHRVVGSTGGLTGYAGGLDKKKFLLRLEGVDERGMRQSA